MEDVYKLIRSRLDLEKLHIPHTYQQLWNSIKITSIQCSLAVKLISFPQALKLPFSAGFHTQNGFSMLRVRVTSPEPLHWSNSRNSI